MEDLAIHSSKKIIKRQTTNTRVKREKEQERKREKDSRYDDKYLNLWIDFEFSPFSWTNRILCVVLKENTGLQWK
jgi:hypothetical protein